jgi:hypothetical protein
LASGGTGNISHRRLAMGDKSQKDKHKGQKQKAKKDADRVKAKRDKQDKTSTLDVLKK